MKAIGRVYCPINRLAAARARSWRRCRRGTIARQRGHFQVGLGTFWFARGARNRPRKFQNARRVFVPPVSPGEWPPQPCLRYLNYILMHSIDAFVSAGNAFVNNIYLKLVYHYY